ncbi:hypothetical protein [Rhizobium daejeonense]
MATTGLMNKQIAGQVGLS